MPVLGGIGQDEAKKRVIEYIRQGMTVRDATAKVSRTVKTYEAWRWEDPEFKRIVNEIRAIRRGAMKRGIDEEACHLSFAEWRKKFLDQDTYPHQQMWIDVLEGREPELTRKGILYEPGRKNRVLINTPPYHAKSATITVQYITYRICLNPQIRVLLVSKTQELAKQFLYSIKKLLTDPQYLELQKAYAPSAEGFKGDVWTASRIYVAGRDGAESDPTVQALGLQGHIYGRRSDLIILDDVCTLDNAHNYEKQMTWLNQEVASRAKDGKILVVGTRVAPVDIYSELRNPDNYISNKSPWTYLGQPAVLEFAEKATDWVTLWPKSNMPLDEEFAGEPDEDGLYPAWDGPALDEIRNSVKANTWALIYMQQAISEDAVFNPICVQGSVEGRRKPGPLRAGAWGHPRNGPEGQYVIGSIDPAATGDAFILIYSVDRQANTRRVLNCWTRCNTIPSWYAEQIETLTQIFGVNEWVIEQNAYANWLIYDERIVDWCRNHGVKITPHYTSRNKLDPDFGVASVAPLFGTIKRHVDGGRPIHAKDNLIELPDPNQSEGVRALMEQLIVWIPNRRGKDLKQDGPMALWFAELRAREVLGFGQRKRLHYMDNKYLSSRDKEQRVVIPMSAYRLAAAGG